MNVTYRPTVRGRSIGITALCICTGLVAGAPAFAAPTARTATAKAATEMNRHEKLALDINIAMGLTQSELITLQPNWTLDRPFATTVAVAGTSYTLDLVPYSNRTAYYQLLVDDGSGELIEHEPGPVNTFRGIAWEAPGSVVAASVLDGGLHAMIDFADGTRYWIEPVGDRVAGVGPDTYVVYNSTDSLGANGNCGMNDQALAGMHAAAFGGGGEDEESGGAASGGAATGDVSVAELGVDADFDYYQDYGSSIAAVENRVNAVINTVNVQYQNEVDITHEITAIIVRTSQVYNSTGAGALLSEFRSRWLSFHGSIPRDVVHLFTGRELDSSTIGIAWGIGEICTNGAFCLAQSDCCGGLGCATDLTAHELGHLWGGFHCDPCSTTMRSFIGCFNDFGTQTNNSIAAHRDSRSCLNSEPITGYCSAVSATSTFDYVSRVQLGDIDHSTANSSYSDFTDISTGLLPGEPIQLTITVGLGGAATIGGAWIDWNQDEDFSDLWETITNNFQGTGPYTVMVTVPSTALFGQTRMRVRTLDGASDPFPQACGVADFGEVEDYTVIVQDIPAPLNNNCADAEIATEGLTAFTTIGATTDGPLEPIACNFSGSSEVLGDVWFQYDATCVGNVTVNLCDADYNTRLAIYDQGCPTQSLEVLVCNDDACGLQSEVTFLGFPGSSYLIRVGGFEGARGSGNMDISIECFGTTGACCFADGSCLESGGSSECSTAGGTFQGTGSTCEAVQCPQPDPTGACCATDGSCAVVTEAACDAAGSTYQGNDSDCGTVQCPQPDPTGACCASDGSCSVATEADCGAAGSTYQGDDVDCGSVQCPLPCPADLDEGGDVGFSDLLLLLADWGPCVGCTADLDGNDDVGFSDLLLLLADWGPC